MTVNMAWPRASVYNPTGGSWYLQWFSVLLLAGTFLTGAVAYAYLRRENRLVGAGAGSEAAPASAGGYDAALEGNVLTG
jgi:hypothetical protein